MKCWNLTLKSLHIPRYSGMLRQGIFLRNNIPKIPQVPWEGACAPSLGSKTQPGIAWNSEPDSGELPPSQFQGFQLLFPPLFPKNWSFAIPGALEPRLRLTSKQGKRLECHGFTCFGHFGIGILRVIPISHHSLSSISAFPGMAPQGMLGTAGIWEFLSQSGIVSA